MQVSCKHPPPLPHAPPTGASKSCHGHDRRLPVSQVSQVIQQQQQQQLRLLSLSRHTNRSYSYKIQDTDTNPLRDTHFWCQHATLPEKRQGFMQLFPISGPLQQQLRIVNAKNPEGSFHIIYSYILPSWSFLSSFYGLPGGIAYRFRASYLIFRNALGAFVISTLG